MKGGRYGDRICGRNQLWVLQRGGSPGHEEGREGEEKGRERGNLGGERSQPARTPLWLAWVLAVCLDRGTRKLSHKENMSPKPLTGKTSQWG